MSDVTYLLTAIERGDPAAAEQLLPLVYNELRKLAAARLAQEQPGQTLQATALVHEAYLRLVGSACRAEPESPADSPAESSPAGGIYNTRAHFFGAAAEAMRRILVDNARSKGRLKRGGDWQRVTIESLEAASDEPEVDILAVDEAISLLAQEHPDKAQLVKLRYFAGLTLAEAAELLEISTATAERHWRYARAWLAQCLRAGVQ